MKGNKYRIKPGFIMREIAGESFAVPVDAENGSSNIVILNPVSKLLWENLQEERTIDELVKAVRSQFEIDPETAKNDIVDFIEELEINGFLV
ncbi:MAG: PqqD family protein [Acutalibacteraceae bacterium]